MQDLDSQPKKMTSFNQVLAGLKLGQVAEIKWKTDGFQADGVITYPPDYKAGQTYPLLLYIHGGPMSASLTNFDRIVHYAMFAFSSQKESRVPFS
jgi:dipeptidyl aminopeptidase/acylaminoacyl peptidase